MKYFPYFQLGCSVLSGSLGGEYESQFHGFLFIDDPPFFPPQNFAVRFVGYTEEFACLLEYLWFII